MTSLGILGYIGVDPSLRSTGVVALDEHGALIHAMALEPGRMNLAERAAFIASCVRYIDRVVLVEQPAIRGGGMAFERAVIAGAVLAKAEEHQALACCYVNPIHVKQYILGKLKRGEMGKDNVRLAVFKRWGFEHESNDVVDAYVLAKMAHAWHHAPLETEAVRRILGKVKR